MRYKATVIIAVLLLVVLGGTYFFHETVIVSELENRNMYTFDMIFHPVTDEASEVYNAEKGFSDRLEDALKDQVAVRDDVVLLYADMEGKLGNIYNRIWTRLFFRPEEEIDLEETEAETERPKEGYPDEYYDLAVNEETERDPETLDFEKYPGYGYARVPKFTPRNYTLTSAGQDLWYINGTNWVNSAPNTGTTLSSGSQATLAVTAGQLQTILDAYPQITMYHYFVTQTRDTPWFDKYLGAEFLDSFEHIAQALPEEIKLDIFRYEDIEDYKATNYASDHHWSHLGSERGYQNVYAMMAEDLDLSPFKYPVKEWNFSELYGVEYRGSRANKLKDSYVGYDEFIVFEYDLGTRETFILDPANLATEVPVTMTLFEKYKVGNINTGKYYDHYINFYGQCYDETGRSYADSQYVFVIKNDNGAAHNILMVGDSTQRAYRDVISSHFGTAVYLDYRIMSKTPVDMLIETYDIDVILVGGLTGCYWLSGNRFCFSDNFAG